MALMLGIESSCDETAAAVVEDGRTVRSNAVSSQMAKHAVYGGVVPELAAREHLTAIEKVCAEALDTAGVTMKEIDAVAVTHAPGLVPALLVGVNFAKGLTLANNKPLIGINHFDDQNFTWINRGGFSNTKDTIEETRNGVKMTLQSQIGPFTPIETNVWYDYPQTTASALGPGMCKICVHPSSMGSLFPTTSRLS